MCFWAFFPAISTFRKEQKPSIIKLVWLISQRSKTCKGTFLMPIHVTHSPPRKASSLRIQACTARERAGCRQKETAMAPYAPETGIIVCIFRTSILAILQGQDIAPRALAAVEALLISLRLGFKGIVFFLAGLTAKVRLLLGVFVDTNRLCHSLLASNISKSPERTFTDEEQPQIPSSESTTKKMCRRRSPRSTENKLHHHRALVSQSHPQTSSRRPACTDLPTSHLTSTILLAPAAERQGTGRRIGNSCSLVTPIADGHVQVKFRAERFGEACIHSLSFPHLISSLASYPVLYTATFAFSVSALSLLLLQERNTTKSNQNCKHALPPPRPTLPPRNRNRPSPPSIRQLRHRNISRRRQRRQQRRRRIRQHRRLHPLHRRPRSNHHCRDRSSDIWR